nr:hypothetical protein [Desulfobacterales bacterium]
MLVLPDGLMADKWVKAVERTQVIRLNKASRLFFTFFHGGPLGPRLLRIILCEHGSYPSSRLVTRIGRTGFDPCFQVLKYMRNPLLSF